MISSKIEKIYLFESMLWGTILFTLFTACSSPSDYRSEGRKIIHQLIQEFETIETSSQLNERRHTLQRQFNALARAMVRGRKNGTTASVTEKEFKENRLLQHHLERLSKLPGGREIIKRSQEEALITLAD